MKRKLLALILTCLMSLGLAPAAGAAVEELVDLRIDGVTAYSQEEGIYTVVQNGLYGFYRVDGTQLLAPEYAAVEAFSGGLAAVSLSGEWESVRTETSGTVRILRGGRFGYVDASGAMVIPMRYSRAFPFVDGRAFAVDASTGALVLIDELGQELATFPEAEVLASESVRFSEGRAILPIRSTPEEPEDAHPPEELEKPEEAEKKPESEEPAESSESTEEAPLTYLVIDEWGKELCTLTDAYVDFTNGYHSGRVAVAAEGTWETDPSGEARRFRSGAWGYRDERGERAVDCLYDSAAAFPADGLAAVSVRDGQDAVLWGFLNPDGEAVVPLTYEAVQPYSDGMAAVRRNGTWAYIDAYGRTLTGFIYDKADPFGGEIALARRGGRVYAIDRQGRSLFSVEAVSGRAFSGGVAALRRQDGLYGIYDETGGELVPFSYENAYNWDGYLWLKRGNLWRVYETAEVITVRQAAPQGVSVDVSAFTDVPADAWYAEAVTWAVDHDVITGTGGGQFSPDKPCTVGEILTFLWRAAGRPEPSVENPFTDVTASHYYYQAALWAYENGLVEGDVFGASELCSRSMAVTYLWRLDGAPLGAVPVFVDIPWDAPYVQAVAWAVRTGVTSGSGGSNFAPLEICSRSQIVTFLYRYLAEK